VGKILTLGESLLRLSVNNGILLSDAKNMDVSFGGAEANVAINLSQLGNKVAYATKIPQNKITSSLINELKENDVDYSNILFGGERLGTYYLEMGNGYRPSEVIYDRKYSSIGMMKAIEWDLESLLKDIDILHITGITAALSNKWHELILNIIKEAAQKNIIISFDMNYRENMWDVDTAKLVYTKILPYVHYLSAGHLDATVFMDIPEEQGLETAEYYYEKIGEKYSNIKYIYGTNRINKTPNSYKLNGYIYDTKDKILKTSKTYHIDSVIDRVGTGDSYAAGIIHSLYNDYNMQYATEFATMNAVLNHSIYGDKSKFSEEYVNMLLDNDSNIMR